MSAEVLLTREQVETNYGFSPNGLRKLVKEGEFPAPIQVGRKLLRWRLSTINEFIAARDEELNGALMKKASGKKLKRVLPAMAS